MGSYGGACGAGWQLSDGVLRADSPSEGRGKHSFAPLPGTSPLDGVDVRLVDTSHSLGAGCGGVLGSFRGRQLGYPHYEKEIVAWFGTVVVHLGFQLQRLRYVLPCV